MAYWLGRALQIVAMVQLGYALYRGFTLDDQRGEIALLGIGAALFIAGRLIEKRFARA